MIYIFIILLYFPPFCLRNGLTDGVAFLLQMSLSLPSYLILEWLVLLMRDLEHLVQKKKTLDSMSVGCIMLTKR